MSPSHKAVALAPYLRFVRRWQRIQKALARIEPRLKTTAHVVGYGVGPKYKKAVQASELAAVFFVDKKVPKGKLKRRDRLPVSIKVGNQVVPTDVARVGQLKATQQFSGPSGSAENCRKHRPVLMGTSIAVCPLLEDKQVDGGGSSGAVVQDKAGQKYVLSVGHLLTNGPDVIQPSKDLGTPAGHNRVAPPPGQPPDPRDNIGNTRTALNAEIDAGILEAIPSVPQIVHIGKYRPSLLPSPSLTCQKSGARTGLTYGTIEYVGVTAFNKFIAGLGVHVPAFERPGLFFVRNSCSDKPFVDDGDSGSLIVIGWANTTPESKPNLGTAFEKILADLVKFDKVHGRDSERNIRKAMDRAALGLQIEVVPIFIATKPGHASLYPLFGVGQEIDLALNALQVDLVTG